MATQQHITGISLDFEQSPIRLISEIAPVEQTLMLLRTEIAEDERRKATGILESDEAKKVLSSFWYQRIHLPDLDITTTSDLTRLQLNNPGKLHTLFGRLSPIEAMSTRPLAKWDYLSRLMPELSGKSVLEIGSASGYFSLQMAALGARIVTGLESWSALVPGANWLSKRLALQDRVRFFCADAYYDAIPRHDVVFLTEVFIHSIVPYHALFRILGLAKEFVVLDEPVRWLIHQTGDFAMHGHASQDRVSWVSNNMTERMVLMVCHLAGVELSRVTRYRDDREENSNHTCFVIDVRGSDQRRRETIASEYLLTTIERAMGVKPIETVTIPGLS